MKVNEYLAKIIKEESGLVFGITGGCAVNLFDALYKEGIKLIPMHHEQACAMAADAFARVSGKLGTCVVTSGPGATNLITGTCCSYYDSVPILNISGQVPSKHLKQNDILRQYGFQETNVKKLFESITKYSNLIDDPKKFINELNIALYLAKSERSGPVILDICDNVQREEILKNGDVKIEEPIKILSCEKKEQIEKLINKSKRPLLILGHGVHISKCEKRIIDLVNYLNIPTLLTWGALDLLDNDHPLNIRDFGVTAQRIGNFAIKQSDLLICIGTKLDTHEVADYSTFAPNAKKIIIDIDKAELDKLNNHNDIKLNISIKDFLDSIPDLSIGKIPNNWKLWLNNIQKLRKEYRICNEEEFYNNIDGINPYYLMDRCSEIATKEHIIITDAGQTLTWTMQGWKIKEGQRLITAFNHSPMGYSIPAAIGAYYGSNRPVICFVGDGGLQMNIQELQTITSNKLPIKIFVLNNNGYGMIKQTQSDWETLDKGVMCDERSNLTFPDIKKIAKAYNIKYRKEYFNSTLNLYGVFQFNCPEIIEVMIKDGEKIQPKLKFGDALENQKPYLPKEKIDYINKTLLEGLENDESI